MNQSEIFAPFVGMIGLTLVVWVFMYSKRLPFIFSNRLKLEEMTKDEFDRLSPPYVRRPSDNLKNLFEIPVLFYALCLYLFVTGQVDFAYLIAAWMFFVFRIVHSAIHCLTSNIMPRFLVYCVSTAAVWFMALRAGYETIAS